MAPLIAEPFRLGPNGQPVTVDQLSEAGIVQEVAALVRTRLGERELAPGYGMTDPAFDGFRETELLAGLARFGPRVRVSAVSVVDVDDDVQEVAIDFDLDHPAIG